MGNTVKLPPNVVKVFVPFPYKLDPVGYARKQGYADDYYTRDTSNLRRKR